MAVWAQQIKLSRKGSSMRADKCRVTPNISVDPQTQYDARVVVPVVEVAGAGGAARVARLAAGVGLSTWPGILNLHTAICKTRNDT